MHATYLLMSVCRSGHQGRQAVGVSNKYTGDEPVDARALEANKIQLPAPPVARQPVSYIQLHTCIDVSYMYLALQISATASSHIIHIQLQTSWCTGRFSSTTLNQLHNTLLSMQDITLS